MSSVGWLLDRLLRVRASNPLCFFFFGPPLAGTQNAFRRVFENPINAARDARSVCTGLFVVLLLTRMLLFIRLTISVRKLLHVQRRFVSVQLSFSRRCGNGGTEECDPLRSGLALTFSYQLAMSAALQNHGTVCAAAHIRYPRAASQASVAPFPMCFRSHSHAKRQVCAYISRRCWKCRCHRALPFQHLFFPPPHPTPHPYRRGRPVLPAVPSPAGHLQAGHPCTRS